MDITTITSDIVDKIGRAKCTAQYGFGTTINEVAVSIHELYKHRCLQRPELTLGLIFNLKDLSRNLTYNDRKILITEEYLYYTADDYAYLDLRFDDLRSEDIQTLSAIITELLLCVEIILGNGPLNDYIPQEDANEDNGHTDNAQRPDQPAPGNS